MTYLAAGRTCILSHKLQIGKEASVTLVFLLSANSHNTQAILVENCCCPTYQLRIISLLFHLWLWAASQLLIRQQAVKEPVLVEQWSSRFALPFWLMDNEGGSLTSLRVLKLEGVSGL